MSRLADGLGRRAGRFELHCVITLPGPGNRIEQICNGVIRLRDGSVMFATATAPGATTTPAAVTGGTRSYAGARGTLATVGHTDGSATHTVTFTP